MERLIEICAAIIGTLLIVMSLQVLIPAGMWLHLAGLVFGTQLVVMAIRAALHR
jgi:hypothetical protein